MSIVLLFYIILTKFQVFEQVLQNFSFLLWPFVSKFTISDIGSISHHYIAHYHFIHDEFHQTTMVQLTTK